ncbi:D-xylose-proton symporter-like [Thalictrum thalictroides]|uniref:D-xylose-proton symporter-like n=1 Tax=Thalictrum thalictroides TaxID=46969 RepID=A0A7J6XGU4_THATH|nr:D-xylose-proton symporter-like [Thalictrum thalictroides]
MRLGYAVGSLGIGMVRGWRYMFATSFPISLMIGVGIWWLPPSTRWLLLCVVQKNENIQEFEEYKRDAEETKRQLSEQHQNLNTRQAKTEALLSQLASIPSL